MALPMMGGADAQVRPEEYFPPAPRGGLGGLGGFAPSTNDALRATFMSMMSSPSNNWLQNMPQIYAGLRDERRFTEKDQRAQAAAGQEREALKAALVAGGISPGEAEMLSANPAAARLRLEQVASERAAQQEQSFIQGVFSGGDNLSDAPRVDDTGDSWAPHRQEFGWAEPGQGEPDTPVEPTQPNAGATQGYAGPTQVAQAGPQPVSDAYTPPQFQITNPEAQRLMKNREQLVRHHMQAPSDRTRKIIESNISHIDKQLEQLAPTSSQKEYNFDQQQRIAQGLPVQTFSVWDAEQAARRRPETKVSVNTGETSPGWKKIDEAFADTYLSWNSGGFADSMKQVEQLGEAIKILESGENVTGTIGLLPDQLRPFFNEQGTIARENVEEVVQRSLREILGAQFTEKEGERLIARAFNPLLKPEENAKRVRRLMNTIVSMGDAKQDMVNYFDEHGTLKGYRGSRPTMTEINRLADDFGESPEEQEGQIPDGVDPKDWEFLTPEERQMWLDRG
jgi:hypothetical protein